MDGDKCELCVVLWQLRRQDMLLLRARTHWCDLRGQGEEAYKAGRNALPAHFGYKSVK